MTLHPFAHLLILVSPDRLQQRYEASRINHRKAYPTLSKEDLKR